MDLILIIIANVYEAIICFYPNGEKKPTAKNYIILALLVIIISLLVIVLLGTVFSFFRK